MVLSEAAPEAQGGSHEDQGVVAVHPDARTLWRRFLAEAWGRQGGSQVLTKSPHATTRQRQGARIRDEPLKS